MSAHLHIDAGHVHAAASIRMVGWTACVSPRGGCSGAAHGGTTEVETCACGMTRRTESNGRHEETGPWAGETHRAVTARQDTEDRERIAAAVEACQVPVVRISPDSVVLGRLDVRGATARLVGEVSVSWDTLLDAARQDDPVLRAHYSRAYDVARDLQRRW